MITGLRILVRDKTAFMEDGGALREIGNPMEIMRALPERARIVHIADLNANGGNATNFDFYDRMTYSRNIEVEIGPREGLLRKLVGMRARAVLGLPCALDLGKFREWRSLLVGKVARDAPWERCPDVSDYYVEGWDAEMVAEIAGEGKRVFVYSNSMGEEEAEKAGAFALIRDWRPARIPGPPSFRSPSL